MHTQLIEYLGYRYGLERHHLYPTKYWACTRNKCRARALLQPDRSLLLKGPHNHMPNHKT